MYKCSYLCENVKPGKFRTTVTYRYLGTRDGKPMHEVDILEPMGQPSAT